MIKTRQSTKQNTTLRDWKWWWRNWRDNIMAQEKKRWIKMRQMRTLV